MGEKALAWREMRNVGRKGKMKRSFDELILDMLNLTIRRMGFYLWVTFLQVTGKKERVKV